MKIAITGATGRLGKALCAAFEEAPFTGPFGPIGWDRRQLDLDDPASVGSRLDRDHVELVIHAAAWTDADGCALEPELAMRRNAIATGLLAQACASRGMDLIFISTHEVFDGRRTDGRGYGPGDPAVAANAHGASKLAGERAAADAYSAHDRGGRLGIVRTGWLFGSPGRDFPSSILASAERAGAEGRAIGVAGGAVGSPSYVVDVAEGIAELTGSGDVSGIHHLVNAGTVSRADWARELLRQARIRFEVEETETAGLAGRSIPPAWAVLAPTSLPSGEPPRPWQEALADYLPGLLRGRSTRAARQATVPGAGRTIGLGPG